MATLPEIFNHAVQLHQAGRLAVAEGIYRQILEVQPNHAGALHLLGVVAHQQNQHAAALELVRQAIAVQPCFPIAFSNLGAIHKALGNLDEAVAAYRQAIQLKPEYYEAYRNLAVVLNEKKEYDAAIVALREALRLKPDYDDAYRCLGTALKESGDLDGAISAYRRAIELRETVPEAHYDLGVTLRAKREFPAAQQALERAVALHPRYAEAHNSLGLVLFELGEAEAAVAACRKAIEIKPQYPEAYNNLALALSKQGELAQAIAACRQAIAQRPNHPEAYCNLGNFLRDQGDLDGAIEAYQQALNLQPNFAQVHSNFGNILTDQGKLDEAIQAFHRGIELQPELPETYNNLGKAQGSKGRLDEAEATYRQALALQPNYPQALSNLGNVYKDQGKLDEAMQCFRRALEIKPELTEVHSNLLFAMTYAPNVTPAELATAHAEYNQRHAEPLRKTWRPHRNDRAPDRPLKIGYVSGDLCMHPVGQFMLPLLQSHDRKLFRIHAYSSVAVPDKFTDRCRQHIDVWRDLRGVTDEQAAALIREDGIDILVDLSMHTAKNRLLVFARKPAPVQVTYLAYCGSTGLRSIDYRFTNPYLDNPETDRLYYSEESYYLPETIICFRSSVETPPVTPPRVTENKFITFGCLNNFSKVSLAVLDTWGDILKGTPRSQLLLHARQGKHRAQALARFEERGIAAERIRFIDRVSLVEYYATYAQIDIALDPFPYSGGTTTCDALWMGVPIISLAGKTAVERGGLSHLTNVGLPDLVAYDREEYVRIACQLAQDHARVAQIRATLRPTMQASPLMDAPRFARNVEAAYRWMWQRYCAGGSQ